MFLFCCFIESKKLEENGFLTKKSWFIRIFCYFVGSKRIAEVFFDEKNNNDRVDRQDMSLGSFRKESHQQISREARSTIELAVMSKD